MRRNRGKRDEDEPEEFVEDAGSIGEWSRFCEEGTSYPHFDGSLENSPFMKLMSVKSLIHQVSVDVFSNKSA